MKKWISRIDSGQFPIFQHSHRALQQIQADKNQSIDDYRKVILNDPGLTIALLREVNRKKSDKRASIETVGHASLLLGMQRMSTFAMGLPVIEQQPNSISQGYRQAASKAHHAACQAFNWNHYLSTQHSEEIFVAAQMRALCEMGMWSSGGCLQMQKIHDLVQQRAMSAPEAEQKVLGFQLDKLSLCLAERWQLSACLLNSLNGKEGLFPKSNILKLAGDFVTAIDLGWDHPNVGTVVDEVAQVLQMDPELASDRVKSCALSAAQKSTFFGVEHAAFRLMQQSMAQHEAPASEEIPVLVDKEPTTHVQEQPAPIERKPTPPPEEPAPPPEQPTPAEPTPPPAPEVILEPPPQSGHAYLEEVTQQLQQTDNVEALGVHNMLDLVLAGMRRGIGLDRVFFAMLSQNKSALVVRYSKDCDDENAFLKKKISLKNKDLFALLMTKPQSVYVHAENRAKYFKLLPKEFAAMINTQSFLASSIFAHGKPIGMMYADQHASNGVVSREDYQLFKTLCAFAGKGILHLADRR